MAFTVIFCEIVAGLLAVYGAFRLICDAVLRRLLEKSGAKIGIAARSVKEGDEARLASLLRSAARHVGGVVSVSPRGERGESGT